MNQMESANFEYIGDELEVFQYAVNWKRYWRQKIMPYLGDTVLEVGAGIGGTTRIFADVAVSSWVALEPDAAMIRELAARQKEGLFADTVTLRQGTVKNLAASEMFESILYIDVLEHIEDDRGEIEAAAQHVRSGGYIIVLSPAFQFLYTPFDRAIGHYRRYRRPELEALTPTTCRVAGSFYLDMVGLLASMGNLFFLQSSEPNVRQIKFWDSYMVPISRLLDPLIGYRFGRSVVCIWQKEA